MIFGNISLIIHDLTFRDLTKYAHGFAKNPLIIHEKSLIIHETR